MKYLISIFLLIINLVYFLMVVGFTLFLTLFMSVKRVDPLLEKLFRFVFYLNFSPVTIENQASLDKNKPYIYMPNHVSFFDVFFLQFISVGFMRGIEKETHFHWPLYGYFVKKMGNIPIKQNSVQGSLQSFKKAKAFLDAGNSITLFPEGHRNLDGKLQAFKRLPFLLAKEAGVDIVPVGLSGMHRLMSASSWIIRPTHIKAKIGKVITAEEVAQMDVNELLDRVKKEIESLIERP